MKFLLHRISHEIGPDLKVVFSGRNNSIPQCVEILYPNVITTTAKTQYVISIVNGTSTVGLGVAGAVNGQVCETHETFQLKFIDLCRNTRHCD